MRFITPPAYHLVIGIIFPKEANNLQQIKQTHLILKELQNFLKDEFGVKDCIKKPEKKSLGINYFLSKEGSYKGSKYDFTQSLKKLRTKLKELEKRYKVSFHTYLYNQLKEFFTD